MNMKYQILYGVIRFSVNNSLSLISGLIPIAIQNPQVMHNCLYNFTENSTVGSVKRLVLGM